MTQCGSNLRTSRSSIRSVAGLWVITLTVLAGCRPSEEVTSQAPPAKSAPPTNEQAVSKLRNAAERGDAAAQSALGDLLVQGHGVKRDYEQAARWYRKAAEQNHLDAQNSLGMLYQAGRGVPFDDTLAAGWFQKAADQGHTEAIFNLASLNAAGRGVPQDSTNAARLYLRAAEAGDAIAQYNMGQRYELGRGVETNLIQAYKWHELAARQGLPDAATARDQLRTRMDAGDLTEALRRVEAFQRRQTNAPGSK